MLDYVKRAVIGLLRIDFFRFCIVGSLGFLLNSIILLILYNSAHLSAFWSQFIAAEVALFSNFILHHKWTYKRNKTRKSIKTLIVQFHIVSWPAILLSTIIVGSLVEFIHINPTLSLVISSVVILFWNFVWTKFYIWNDSAEPNTHNRNKFNADF